MKAAVAAAARKKWEIREVPTPKPGPNQVLIKVRASGLCYTDVHITQGFFGENFPLTLGHEPVGEIVELGPGVRTRRTGDRVGVPWVQATCGRCEWCQRGKFIHCPEQIGTGVGIGGGHAEYMLAYADATALIPEKLSYEQAAPIFCAGYTVWSGLRWADPKPHEKVAVVGIGGLGHLAVQYASAAGFETIAVTHSPDKVKLAKELGADAVVSDGAGLEKAGGADVVLATSNSYAATADAIRGLRPDGRLVVMGLDSGELKIGGMDLLLKRLKVMGSLQNHSEYLYEALDMAARGQVKVVAETFKFEDIGKAYDRVAEGKVRFRAVIRVD